MRGQPRTDRLDQFSVSFACIGIYPAVLPWNGFVLLIFHRDVVQIKLVAGQIDVVPIDLVEVMRPAAFGSDFVNRSAKHIVHQRCRYCALPIGGIIFVVIVLLTAWISGILAPNIQ